MELLNTSTALVAGDPTQADRLIRDGVPSDWSVSKTYPGSIGPANVHYHTYTVTPNATGFLQIQTKTNSTAIFTSAYLSSYGPVNLANSYLGDAGFSGNSFGNAQFFQVQVNAGQTVVIVVNEVSANGGVGVPFTLLVEGFTNVNYSEPVAVTGSDLTITKTHTGNFALSQTGATYTITVSNVGVLASPSRLVTVQDLLPAGLTATAISGTGWSCNLGSGIVCLRAGSLAAGASFPPITLTVNVAANAPGTVTNVATVAISNDGSTANNSASDVTTINGGSGGGGTPDLIITKTHTGNFTQGQTGATYTITAGNSGTAATTGTVTVVDTLPAGLTATGISGTGWACTLGTLTCTRSDALAIAGSYPPITVIVNVAGNAAASITNTATVSGGGESNTANNTASDPTTVVGLSNSPVDFSITKSHTGNFTHGGTGTYTITVQNVGTVASVGLVNVNDTLPAGMTAVTMTGTGWVCVASLGNCIRSNSLAPSASYPPITLTVNISAGATGTLTNTVKVANNQDTNAANNTATDPTTIN